MPDNHVYSLNELKALSLESAAPESDLLFVDLRGASVSDEEVRSLNRWLSRQSVPVIGRAEMHTPLAAGLDLLVQRDEEFAQIETSVNRNPQAAAVLVQTTRITEQLSVKAALVAESLAYATLQGGMEFKTWLATRPAGGSMRVADAGEPVLLDRQDHRLTLTLNRPGNRNAVSVEMRDALKEAFSLVGMDTSIEQVTVSGMGPAFCAGGDLTEFGTCEDLSEAHRIRQLRMPVGSLTDAAERYTFHLHGACIGAGIEIPAFAGRVIAAPGTWFRLPEVAMGLIPGAGGCVSLPRRIGRHRTNYLAITGIDISVDTALAWGLVDEIRDWQ